MRIIKFLPMLLLLVIFLQSAHGADRITDGALKLSLVNQQPDPVEPGDYVDVRLKIENLGDSSLDDIQIEFIPSYPFSLDPGDSHLKEINSLSSFQKDDRAYMLKYKLRVANNPVEGPNTLKVRAKTGNEDWTNYEFNLNIQTFDANLGISSISTEPSPASPGEDVRISITAENAADSLLKNIKFKLDLTLESFGTKQLDSLPFAPINTGTQKKVNMLESGDKTILNYDVRVYPTAASKVYKIPLLIEYYDELNNKYEKNELIGLVVNSEPELGLTLDQDGGFKPGSSGEVSVRFTNKGLTDVKFLTATLKPTTAFESLSSKEVYLGNIDSDDYELADYDVYVKPTQKEKILLPVYYEYMDANNNKYTASKELELQIMTAEKAEKLGMQDSNNALVIWFVLILVVALFIMYRLLRKKKR
ncbi:MAG: COG1361 S-layer family protein [Nanobdellota archaeon]